MMRAAPLLAACLAAAILAPAAFAGSVDFGGSLTSLSGYGNSSSAVRPPGSVPALTQKGAGNLWFQAAFSDSLLFSLQLGGLIQYTPGILSKPFVLFGDADVLDLEGRFPSPDPRTSLFAFTLGRFRIADFTGLVLDHRADGFLLRFEYPAASLTAAAAYTGLVSKGNSTITLSLADAGDVFNPAVVFAPPRLVELLELSFPSLLGQRLRVTAIFQEDMRDTLFDLAGFGRADLVSIGSTTQVVGQGGAVNTQYFGLGLDGAILGPLFYDIFSYLETGKVTAFQSGSYQENQFFAVLAGGGLRCYLPSLLFSVIGAKLIYVSGDPGASTVVEDGTAGFSMFTPISRATLNSVFSPQLSNVMIAEASWSVKPLSPLGRAAADSLQAVLQADVIFRPTTGQISEPGVVPGSADLYLGTEADLGVTYRPFSDLGLSLYGGVFLPGPAFGSSPALQYKAGLDVSLSF